MKTACVLFCALLPGLVLADTDAANDAALRQQIALFSAAIHNDYWRDLIHPPHIASLSRQTHHRIFGRYLENDLIGLSGALIPRIDLYTDRNVFAGADSYDWIGARQTLDVFRYTDPNLDPAKLNSLLTPEEMAQISAMLNEIHAGELVAHPFENVPEPQTGAQLPPSSNYLSYKLSPVQRLLIDEQGNAFYTNNHYQSFYALLLLPTL